MTVVASARSIPETNPDGIVYIAADLMTAEGCQSVAREVLNRLGGIDVIVNSLGGSSAPGGGFAALNDAEMGGCDQSESDAGCADRQSVAPLHDQAVTA